MERRGNSSSTSLNFDAESISSNTSLNGQKCLRQSPVQLTSLSSLLSHHRYLFLYNDCLVISKQKGPSTFKLKLRVALSRVWLSSANTLDSFLIGWPTCNHLVHFRNREEKNDWFNLLSTMVAQALRPLYTTICMDIQVEGRKQTIRRRIENGRKSAEILLETAKELGMQHASYELKVAVGESTNVKSLQGPENVYTVIMNEVDKTGVRLSESQRAALDTCGLVSARLILANLKASKAPSPKQIMENIKKRVLTSREPRGLFGRVLDGPTPPQPILTIVDHLRMNCADVEGIFRKSPKQSTFKELRAELDRGGVPDFGKYSAHVLASMLKEYLRCVPGKLLLSGNYELWMREVVDVADHESKMTACRNLLVLLPPAHCILLANVLKLLNKISNSVESRMTASALSVCMGPCLIDSNDVLEGGRKIPLLVEFLITEAAQVVPGFSAHSIFAILSQTNEDENANVASQRDYNSDSPSCSTLTIEECSDDGEIESPSSDDCPLIGEEKRDKTIHSTSSSSNSGDTSSGISPDADEAADIDMEAGRRRNSFRDLLASSRRPFSSFSTSSEDDEPQMQQTRPNRRAGSSSVGANASKSSDMGGASMGVASAGGVGVALRKNGLSAFEQPPIRKLSAELAAERKKGDGPRSPCLKRIHFQKTQNEIHQKTEPFKFDNFERLKEKLAEATRQQEAEERERVEKEAEEKREHERVTEERRDREEELRKQREERERRLQIQEDEQRREREHVEEERLRKTLEEEEERRVLEERECIRLRERRTVDTQTGDEDVIEASEFTASRFPPFRGSVLFDCTPESSPRTQRRSFANQASSLVHNMINQRFGNSSVASRNEEKPTVQVQPFTQTTHHHVEEDAQLTVSPLLGRRSIANEIADSPKECIHQRIFPGREEGKLRASPLVARRPPTGPVVPPSITVAKSKISQFSSENHEPVALRASASEPYGLSRKSCPEVPVPQSPVQQRKQIWEERCESPLAVRKQYATQTRTPDIAEFKFQRSGDESPRLNRRKFDSPESPLIGRKFSDVVKCAPVRPVIANRCEDMGVAVVQRTPQLDSRKSDLQRTFSTREPSTSLQILREGIQRAGSVKTEREREWSKVLCRRGEDRCVGLDPLEINWSVRHLKTLFKDSKAPAIQTEYA